MFITLDEVVEYRTNLLKNMERSGEHRFLEDVISKQQTIGEEEVNDTND
jgi:hypothetical protein